MAKELFKLYSDEVEIEFDPEASTKRYQVSDPKAGLVKQAVPGVTTVLGNVFDKPGLRQYPLNKAMEYLFGAKFDNVLLKNVPDQKHFRQLVETVVSQELLDNCYAAAKDHSQKGKDVGTEVHAAIEDYLTDKVNETPVADWTVYGRGRSIEVEKAFRAFREWYDKQKAQPLKLEQPVYRRPIHWNNRAACPSLKNGVCLCEVFAGKFDALLEIDGKVVLVDFKTTQESRSALKIGKDWTGIYPDNFLQLGAYSLAYREEYEESGRHKDGYMPQAHIDRVSKSIQDLVVINVTKQGKVHTISASDLGKTVENFENAARACMRLHTLLADMYKVKPAEVSELANA